MRGIPLLEGLTFLKARPSANLYSHASLSPHPHPVLSPRYTCLGPTLVPVGLSVWHCLSPHLHGPMAILNSLCD